MFAIIYIITFPYSTTTGVTGTTSDITICSSTSTSSSINSTLTVTGDTEITGNLTVKGRNLCDLLDIIESRLAILQINPALEEEFSELRELGDRYREMEAKLTEQKRIFKILKTQD
jgi:hypothetical protein